MTAHVAQRLAKEINKHRGKSLAQSEKSIQSAQEKYSLDQILRKGLAGVAQVTVATHIAKGVHPGLKVKEVTNLNLGPGELTPLPELGSHIASNKSPADTTGNGAHASAAYELYLLLDLEFEGKTLCQWLDEHDPDIVFAFTQGIAEDSDRLALASQFANLMKAKAPRPASHTYAKQLYWLVDEDPVDDGAYHLLAPLYPTSLVHEVYNRIQEDRFGEESKAARGAR
ncbi:type I-F CRISPR-associated protein Csy1, partial [Cephaloticoccus primus]|uniref:type I-F CRISPR-associated protein Csy1 n=1 Tax=Cephaloticoccus primus TaxID=1548207 RepID=UPI0018D4B8A6